MYQQNTNSAAEPRDKHRPSNTLEPLDLICVGFGPASLAIAIALHDKGIRPRVRYLERQAMFSWHSAMLLPNTRMQISFLKDLATLRDPTSRFTFLNYLKAKNRLIQFTNLSTFLPLREEYNDYMRWCAGHFEDDVRYNRETVSVLPVVGPSGKVASWSVLSRDTITGATSTLRARRVVIAVGGHPKLPNVLADLASSSEGTIIHSSSYGKARPKLQNARSIAVIGGGQSGAEIFHDLINRDSSRSMNVIFYIGSSVLRPSDDSPFVNEIFDPSNVDTFYNLPHPTRISTLTSNRSTNYGVVRPELLHKLYEIMYHQRLRQPNEQHWRHRIISGQEVVGWEESIDDDNKNGKEEKFDAINGGNSVDDHLNEMGKGSNNHKIQLKLLGKTTGNIITSSSAFDIIIAATGYTRDAHEGLLEPTAHLLPPPPFSPTCSPISPYSPTSSPSPSSPSPPPPLPPLSNPKYLVSRDYRVQYRAGAVESSCGIWLQGCCEESHGLSDTLLSILSVRGGEMVDSMFGTARVPRAGKL